MRARLALAMVAAAALAAAPPAAAQNFGAQVTGVSESEFGVDEIASGGHRLRSVIWGSRVAPDVEGWILDPRLFIFSFSGSYLDRQTDANNQDSSAITLEPYRFTATAFPYGLYTFMARASRTLNTFELGDTQQSSTVDRYGGTVRYRGSAVLPEVQVDVSREFREDRFVDGSTLEQSRSTLSLRLFKDLDRLRPTVNYVLEDIESETTGSAVPFEPDGLRQRLRYDDRIRLGDRAILTPVLEYAQGPLGQDVNASATIAGPLTGRVDGSGSLRYSLFDHGHGAVHATAAQGQLTTRFTNELVLTTVGNATYVEGGGGPGVWSGGGVGALRAAPWSWLRMVTDYGLQLTGGEDASVNHRGHVNVVATVIPKHTITADYFGTFTQTSRASGAFAGHTVALDVVSDAMTATRAFAGYRLEQRESAGVGDYDRQGVRAGAEVRPNAALLLNGLGEGFVEDATGANRIGRHVKGVIGGGGATYRPGPWLELMFNGRFGMKDVHREDRVGTFPVIGATASAAVVRPGFNGRLEAFYERDDDLRTRREGARATLSYKFRAWTLSAEAEFAHLTIQTSDTSRQHVRLRLSRPLNFFFP